MFLTIQVDYPNEDTQNESRQSGAFLIPPALQINPVAQPRPRASLYSQPSSEWSGNTLQLPNNAPPSYYPSQPETPVTPAGEPLLPSHLKVHQFGSRFLPHTTYPMNALLPVLGDRLLLIGHDNGLSVLDIFPTGDPETSGPGDAQVRPIWEGEGCVNCALSFCS